jgi:entericidin B
MKKLIAAMGILMVVGLTGCNTMRGMGQDVERGGEKVQDASSRQQAK